MTAPTPTLEAERAAFEAWAISQEWLTSRNNIGMYRDSAARFGWSAWQAARRAAPAAEGVALPPLPEPKYVADDLADIYTAEQVRQAQRDAVEADRRAREKEHLSEMAAWARENGLSVPPAWEGTVIDYGSNLDNILRQFPELPEPLYSALGLPDIFTAEQMFEYASKHIAPYAERIRQLERDLADARTARAAPEGWKLVPIESTMEMDDAGHDTLLGRGANVEINDAEACWSAMIAAAPQMDKGREEGK